MPIAEIAFDPTPIPIGKDTSNWDKLAQRNIAWSDAGSAQAVTTFEIRPTATELPAGQTPDELMIDWGSFPNSSAAAQIYLPAVKVADILAMASRMYSTHHLTRVDDHTLQCKTGGITYVPIPPGGNINYAGLLSVDVPTTARRAAAIWGGGGWGGWGAPKAFVTCRTTTSNTSPGFTAVGTSTDNSPA